MRVPPNTKPIYPSALSFVKWLFHQILSQKKPLELLKLLQIHICKEDPSLLKNKYFTFDKTQGFASLAVWKHPLQGQYNIKTPS